MKHRRRSLRHAFTGTIALGGLLTSVALVAAQPSGPTTVSQKGRTYSPGEVVVGTGGTLLIVNDDIFIHHVFVDHEDLEFDSGSMDEGESTQIRFDTPGLYRVGCAIHPKMKLMVTVK